MHNSDVGFERSSARDARFMQFIADGPGIAGFRLDVDPETDGDAAAQFLAGADKARIEEGEVRLNRAREWAHIDSLEALTDLGVQFGDPDALKAVEAYEDAEEIRDLPAHLIAQFDENDDEDDGEGTIAALDPKYLEGRRPGAISTYRSAEVVAQATDGRRQGVPRFGIAARLHGMVDVVRFVERHIAKAGADRKAAEASRATETTAKPEPPKGNGNGHKSAPSVGKFLAGIVVDQGPKGLLVDIGNGLFARVPIADERGHGSWDAAATWVLGFKPGTKVRIRVIRTNGHMEAILADRHPRPFWKKEVNQQATEEARPAN